MRNAATGRIDTRNTPTDIHTTRQFRYKNSITLKQHGPVEAAGEVRNAAMGRSCGEAAAGAETCATFSGAK